MNLNDEINMMVENHNEVIKNNNFIEITPYEDNEFNTFKQQTSIININEISNIKRQTRRTLCSGYYELILKNGDWYLIKAEEGEKIISQLIT